MGVFGYPTAFLHADMFRHPVELRPSQLSLAARELASVQELVTGDAALPNGVEDGTGMMLMSPCRGWSFVITSRPETCSQTRERVS